MKTKYIAFIDTFIVLLIGGLQDADAQFCKKFKKKVEQRAQETIEKKVEEKQRKALILFSRLPKKKGAEKNSGMQIDPRKGALIPYFLTVISDNSIMEFSLIFNFYSNSTYTRSLEIVRSDSENSTYEL